MSILSSELILNHDGSVYHLNLKPEDIANQIITVGDPDRVDIVAAFFDTIEFSKRKREFYTVTGSIGNHRLTVISSGIGTDNIDIVINELDALANVNFKTREINPVLKKLEFIRIGTTGGLQKDIEVNNFVVSEMAIGMDSLMNFYTYNDDEFLDLKKEIFEILGSNLSNIRPYITKCNSDLLSKTPDHFTRGITLTACGFYGPQGRLVRAPIADQEFVNKISKLTYNGLPVTNLEMETSGIYGLSHLLNHTAISYNVILANRQKGTFSYDAKKYVSKLIEEVLDIILQP